MAGDNRDVGAGTIVYVAAGVEHHFHSIEEDLKVVVFWSPPRHANASGSATDSPPEAGLIADDIWAGSERHRHVEPQAAAPVG